MNRVVLINPPRTNVGVSELGPPLGLIRLAGMARRLGVETEIVDLNLLWHSSPAVRASFYDEAVALILAARPTVCGLTSMAVDTHVAIELARQIKHADPSVRTVVGGPHFSAIGRDAQSQFPWIDDVVRGEGDQQFADLLKLTGPHNDEAELDHDRIDLSPYFAINPGHVIDVESSRGCVFQCRFCYSPGHFPGQRYFDIDALCLELANLRARGTKHVFFVDDNYLNNRVRVLALCAALRAAKLGLTWHCYGTIPQVDAEIAEALASAGCIALFTGIDAVGVVSQKAYGKRFMRSEDQSMQKVRILQEAGIQTTCAFLVAPPSHDCGVDFETTLNAALAVRSTGAYVRLNVLTYYPGTAIASNAPTVTHDNDFRATLQLDVPDLVARNPLARLAPTLFPFHVRYVAQAEWESFLQQVHSMFTLLHSRTEQLLELKMSSGMSLGSLAQRVALEAGPLLSLPSSTRRLVETSVFDRVLAVTAS